MAELLIVDRAGDVAVLRLDRPDRRNALSAALLHALRAALEGDGVHDAVALVLSGNGGVFSAGADLHEQTATSADLAIDRLIGETADVLRGLPIPTVAAVEGACVGAGFEIAMACDIRIAAEGAFFHLPAAQLGLLYRPTAIARLHRLLGHEVLSRLSLMGERMSAADALAARIVTRVVPAGRAEDQAIQTASAGGRGVRDAVAGAKYLLVALDDGSFDPDRWADVQASLIVSPSRARALEEWKGRRKAQGTVMRE